MEKFRSFNPHLLSYRTLSCVISRRLAFSPSTLVSIQLRQVGERCWIVLNLPNRAQIFQIFDDLGPVDHDDATVRRRGQMSELKKESKRGNERVVTDGSWESKRQKNSDRWMDQTFTLETTKRKTGNEAWRQCHYQTRSTNQWSTENLNRNWVRHGRGSKITNSIRSKDR